MPEQKPDSPHHDPGPARPEKHPQGAGIAIGMGAGLAVGVALGVALDNIGLGLALGVAIGAGIGTSMEAAFKKKRDEGGGEG